MTQDQRERLERRRTVIQRDIATANGEWYQELKSELAWLNRVLPKEV